MTRRKTKKRIRTRDAPLPLLALLRLDDPLEVRNVRLLTMREKMDVVEERRRTKIELLRNGDERKNLKRSSRRRRGKNQLLLSALSQGKVYKNRVGTFQEISTILRRWKRIKRRKKTRRMDGALEKHLSSRR
jgi:hypothetical protein